MKRQYHSLAEAREAFEVLATERPDLIQIQSIGQSWEDREILLVTLTLDVTRAAEKPALLYTGTIHAREWIGIELGVAFARHVVQNLELDEELRQILTRATLYMIPCLNPDGFELSRRHFSGWRKNCRKNADGTMGVDLNRNFPIGFRSHGDSGSNLYPGPEPFSEPETRAVRDFVESHPNLAIALDYHSHGNVFFPAHNFRHEDSADTTDMNVFCANMAEEIRKVSGREYGIHQGKPPASMISGSGREYYHSRGMLASVVEVGSRNISDFRANMAEHIREHVPALLAALKEAPNHTRDNPLQTVAEFQIKDIQAREVTLTWSHARSGDVYFELYRSEKEKHYCLSSNRVVRTRGVEYTDQNLKTATDYYYFIRAVDEKRGIKSPFAPLLSLKTRPDLHEFYKILYPRANEIGSVSEKPGPHELKFGINSLFVGVSEARGVCYGVVCFSLDSMPTDAVILSAHISLYPINRVPARVERFGEWNVGVLDPDSFDDMTDFQSINNARVLQFVGKPTKSQHLTQGIWRSWHFTNHECQLLGQQLKRGQAHFLVTGPTTLPTGRTSQMMMWDIGYGRFGYGMTFRPKLEITYTLPPQIRELSPCATLSLDEDHILPNTFCVAVTPQSKKSGYLAFDLKGIADHQEEMVLTNARLEFTAVTSAKIPPKKNHARLHVDFLEAPDGVTPESLAQVDIIEQIDFDLSFEEIRREPVRALRFDTLALEELDRLFQEGRKAAFLFKATTSDNLEQEESLELMGLSSKHPPRLVIHCLPKRRKQPKPIQGLAAIKEQEMVKLTWQLPDDPANRGALVVKNPFRIPLSPNDGQKLYGGKDPFTFDRFGAMDVAKYYGVFAYDDVPNFSPVEWIRYQPPQEKATGYLADLETLVRINSHTANKKGVDQVGATLEDWLARIGYETVRYPRDQIGDHLLFRAHRQTGERLLLLGHMDTVFPPGEFDHFRLDSEWIHGPGVCDMKGGLIVAIEALRLTHAAFGRIHNIDLLLVSDEETGSDDSKALTASLARDYDFAFVFEAAGREGELVVGRKGVGTFTFDFEGVAAHAGNHYADGVDANRAAAQATLFLTSLTDLAKGTTVNVGKMTGGLSANTISPRASLVFETRYETTSERDRLLAAVEQFVADTNATDQQAKITLSGGIQRDVMEPTPRQGELLSAITTITGATIPTECRGGVSDANITSSHGLTTLDGFGPFGDGDHTHRERANIESFQARISLVTALLQHHQSNQRLNPPTLS
ncbi:MAG: M20/M25/M40 family metallo-hydrolase [Magnetococcales bacterium]|nr:M20/M25/M40 family metallo-hydrolase [Magnetococcales bacterium]